MGTDINLYKITDVDEFDEEHTPKLIFLFLIGHPPKLIF